MPTIFVLALSLIGAALSTSAAEVAAPQIQCQEATYDFGSRDASEESDPNLNVGGIEQKVGDCAIVQRIHRALKSVARLEWR